MFFPVRLICDGETTEIVNSRTNTIHCLPSGANAFFYQITKKGSSFGLNKTAMIDYILLKNRVCDVVCLLNLSKIRYISFVIRYIWASYYGANKTHEQSSRSGHNYILGVLSVVHRKAPRGQSSD